eukprot:2579132-Rhodomonas_salina.2
MLLHLRSGPPDESCPGSDLCAYALPTPCPHRPILLRLATRCPVLLAYRRTVLRARGAMSGTDIGHSILRFATQCPVLACAIVLRACYAVSGTDLRYAATGSRGASDG